MLDVMQRFGAEGSRTANVLYLLCGGEPEPGQVSGPTVEFATEAPTAGRYLLYFDFQVDGEVHSASFVLSTSGEATAATEAPAETDAPAESPAPADDGHDDSH